MIQPKLPKNFQALAYGFGYLGPVIRVNKCKILKKAGYSLYQIIMARPLGHLNICGL